MRNTDALSAFHSNRAGERIRTADVQLGKPQGVDSISLTDKSLTPTPNSVCTSVCTNNSEIAKTTDLDALAAELLKLPKEERARLVALMLGKG